MSAVWSIRYTDTTLYQKQKVGLGPSRIIPDFSGLSVTLGYVPTCSYLVCHGPKPIRLACLIHAASVHPELGSNSKLKRDLNHRSDWWSCRLWVCGRLYLLSPLNKLFPRIRQKKIYDFIEYEYSVLVFSIRTLRVSHTHTSYLYFLLDCSTEQSLCFCLLWIYFYILFGCVMRTVLYTTSTCLPVGRKNTVVYTTLYPAKLLHAKVGLGVRSKIVNLSSYNNLLIIIWNIESGSLCPETLCTTIRQKIW